MKSVKDLCLGVAVAGVVAGAGSALGCAVAFADAESTDASDSAGSRSVSRPDAGPAARQSSSAEPGNRHAGLARTGDSGASVGSGSTLRKPAVSARAATRLSASASPNPAVPSQPSAPLSLPTPPPLLPAAPAGTMSSAAVSTARSRSASATASQIGDPDPTHVLLIGTDGTNLSKVLDDIANQGFFDLMDESVTGATSIVGHTTISGPSWTTILTGVWDNKSGVINNLFDPAPYIPWPTVFNQLEYFDSTIDTAVFADWQYINDIAGAGSYPVAPADNVFVEFSNSWADTDALVVDATIARINATQASTSTFIFSYQVQVDEAGHTYGGGSPEYAQAVTNVSDNIGEIMAAVSAWETATGEDWTVIVTTDHGHQQSAGFGHGFQSPNETSSFVIADFAGDSYHDGWQNLGYSNADITPTIINLFGAPQRSDFDGVPMESNLTVLNGLVEPSAPIQALRDAIAMFGYPNIGVDIALGVRTVFASIPYFLDGFVTTVTDQLQAIVDADIFLVSALAAVAEFVVEIVGDIAVGATQALARVVATLTGSGVIPPSDPPLPPPSSAAVPPVPSAAVLV